MPEWPSKLRDTALGERHCKLLEEVNGGDTVMPDGRPAHIASVVLKGLFSWKDLGIHTLREGLGYPALGRLTQREVWERVVVQAREQGIISIHYDECQHIFPKKTRQNRPRKNRELAGRKGVSLQAASTKWRLRRVMR